jgi:hypothetical protein
MGTSPHIFLSYALTEDNEVAAARLRAIAAVHGLTLRLPLRDDRPDRLLKETRDLIAECDAVLVLANTAPNGHVSREVAEASRLHKPVIIIAEQRVDLGHIEELATTDVIRFDSSNPKDRSAALRKAIHKIAPRAAAAQGGGWEAALVVVSSIAILLLVFAAAMALLDAGDKKTS